MVKNKTYLRHLLLVRSDWMEQRLFDNAEQNGYGDVTAAMSRMCAHLAGRPISLSELARRLAVSRQAVHKMTLDLAKLGYVEFVDSESDARLKLVQFTAKGRDMAASAEKELIAIERELAKHIGADNLQTLKDILATSWSSTE